MPTGYTYLLAEGGSFHDFATACARGFVPHASMRERTHAEGIPDVFHPDPRHAGKVQALRNRLALLQRMTRKQCAAAALREARKAEKERLDVLAEKQKLREIYTSTQRQVEAWQVPETHMRLKRFMLEQLERSLTDDCRERPRDTTPVLPLSAESWKEKEIAEVTYLLSFYEQAEKEEREGAEAATEWVRVFKGSIILK